MNRVAPGPAPARLAAPAATPAGGERPRGPRRATILAALAAAWGCGGAPPPDLLLLTVDTLRPDYLSMNGYDRATSPRLDAILAEGFYFEQAVSPVPRTTPALASLLTGRYPHETGVRRLTDPMREGVTSVTEILRDEGYQTVAVVSNQVLVRRRGLDRGFDVYDMASDDRAARATTDAALERLAALDPELPVLLWVHYIDPHVPYHPEAGVAARMDPGYTGPFRFHFGWQRQPGEPREAHRTYPEELPKRRATHHNPLPEAVNEHVRRLYAGDIRMLDEQIGRLVAALRERLGDDLLLVFASDHGESLGEHDFYFDHGDYVYNAGTRVPLAFVLPADHPLRGSGRCRGWVSLVDVAPTLLELLELPPRPDLPGRSLTPCMRGESLAEAAVFAESGHAFFFDSVRRRQRNDLAGRFRAVTRGRWKLVYTPFLDEAEAYELYDVEADPHETRDLYRPDHPAVAPLREELRVWLARQPAEASEPRELTEEDRRALRQLGYLDEDS